MGVAERKEREKEQRRNDIIDAAEEVFFSRSVENATMDDVARTAELSKGTLYLYFKTKDELLHAIICRGLVILYDKFIEAVGKVETGFEKIAAIGNAYFQFYKEYRNYFFAMLHQDKHAFDLEDEPEGSSYACCQEMGKKIFKLMEEFVRLGIEDGTIREDLDPVRIPLILWAHSAGVVQVFSSHRDGLKEKFHVDLEELWKDASQLVHYYLKKNK